MKTEILVEIQQNKLVLKINVYFIQAVLFADRTNLLSQKFIYALLWLAEKPAVKFLKPAVYKKKYVLGVYRNLQETSLVPHVLN